MVQHWYSPAYRAAAAAAGIPLQAVTAYRAAAAAAAAAAAGIPLQAATAAAPTAALTAAAPTAAATAPAPAAGIPTLVQLYNRGGVTPSLYMQLLYINW